MKITIDDYRCQLINEILFASSQQEIKKLVCATVKSLEAHRVKDQVVKKFIIKAIENLETYQPAGYKNRQWANIRMALMNFSTLYAERQNN